MNGEAQRSSANGRSGSEIGAARLAEARRRGMITLKADLADPTIATAVQMAVGVETPAPRRCHASGESGAVWMAPDELLLLAPVGEVGAKIRLIEETAVAGAIAVDVSDARAVLQLAGPGARETLAKVAPIDLHPSAFGLGDARRTRIGHVPGMIVQTSATPETFEIYCFRSVADYMWDLLSVSSEPSGRIGLFSADA